MKKAIFALSSVCVVASFVACAKKETKVDASYDEQAYTTFSKVAFNEKEKSIKFEEKSDSAHVLVLNEDKTLEIRYLVSLGFVSQITGDTVYNTQAEVDQAITSKLAELKEAAAKEAKAKDKESQVKAALVAGATATPAAPTVPAEVQKTNDAQKTAEAQKAASAQAEVTKAEASKAEGVAVPCMMTIKGKNLVSRKDSEKLTNEKGDLVGLEFEVTEVKNEALKGTSSTLPAGLQAKACAGDKFAAMYAKKTANKSVNSKDDSKKQFIHNWFEISGDESFLKATKGKFQFNSMTSTTLTYKDITLEKRTAKEKDGATR